MYKNNCSFALEFKRKYHMLYYLKKYPLTLLIVTAIFYLSFFIYISKGYDVLDGIRCAFLIEAARYKLFVQRFF